MKREWNVNLFFAALGALALGTSASWALEACGYFWFSWWQLVCVSLLVFVIPVIEKWFGGSTSREMQIVKKILLVISWVIGAVIGSFVLLFLVTRATGILPGHFYRALRENGGLRGAFWSLQDQRSIAVGLALTLLVIGSVIFRSQWWAKALLLPAFIILVVSWLWWPNATVAALNRRHNADQAVARTLNEKGFLGMFSWHSEPKHENDLLNDEAIALQREEQINDARIRALEAQIPQPISCGATDCSQGIGSSNSEVGYASPVTAVPISLPILECFSPVSEEGGDSKVELCTCTKSTPQSDKVSCTGYITNTGYRNQQKVWTLEAAATDELEGASNPMPSTYSPDGGFGFCGNKTYADLSPGVRTKFCLWFKGATPNATSFAFSLKFLNDADNSQAPKYFFQNIPVVSISR